jgi:hypothetical protein
MNVLLAVRRVFKRNLLVLLDWKQVSMALKGLCKDFLSKHGPRSLIPKRAAPLTNELYLALAEHNQDFNISKQDRLCWGDRRGKALRAALGVARASGMRKEELRLLMRGSVSFFISGVVHHRPSPAQLAALSRNDFLVIVPPPSTADQLGVIWGSLPIYIPVRQGPGCAATLVANLLLDSEMADDQLVISDQTGSQLSAAWMDRAFKAWLESVGVPAAIIGTISWHSARVGLACSLLAANRSPETIQAPLRWRSVESLRAYACIGPQQYVGHLDAAFKASAVSLRAAHLPILESVDLAIQLNHIAATH